MTITYAIFFKKFSYHWKCLGRLYHKYNKSVFLTSKIWDKHRLDDYFEWKIGVEIKPLYICSFKETILGSWDRVTFSFKGNHHLLPRNINDHTLSWKLHQMHFRSLLHIMKNPLYKEIQEGKEENKIYPFW